MRTPAPDDAGTKKAGLFQMNEMLWRTSEAHDRRLDPDASERETFLRTASHHWPQASMTRENFGRHFNEMVGS